MYMREQVCYLCEQCECGLVSYCVSFLRVHSVMVTQSTFFSDSWNYLSSGCMLYALCVFSPNLHCLMTALAAQKNVNLRPSLRGV